MVGLKRKRWTLKRLPFLFYVFFGIRKLKHTVNKVSFFGIRKLKHTVNKVSSLRDFQNPLHPIIAPPLLEGAGGGRNRLCNRYTPRPGDCFVPRSDGSCPQFSILNSAFSIS
jgi:hypothetical protein